MPSSPIVQITEGLAFDDVLLVPHYSTVPHRDAENVDLSVSLGHLDQWKFEHPVIPANMDTIASLDLVQAQADSGGLALLHRFQSIDDEVRQFRSIDVGDRDKLVGASIGVDGDAHERFAALLDAGVKIFCIDIAHGDSSSCEKMIRHIKQAGAGFIIAGNVATGSGARHLWEAGADVVKVGIGPGSLCTTRIETGCGVPQITALIEVAEMREEFQHYESKGIIADGGIKNSGDAVKALALADMVMCGNIFAGCKETGTALYRGSSTHKTNHIEGVVAVMQPKGTFDEILQPFLGNIRSGCSYQGVHGVGGLQYSPHFVKITGAGLRESYPHDVQVVKE